MRKYDPEEWMVHLPGEKVARPVDTLNREQLQQSVCYFIHVLSRLDDYHRKMDAVLVASDRMADI